MPLVLQNSHSHEFSYYDDNGVERRVSLARGQAVPEGVPLDVLTNLASETVVSFNGETLLPRYVNVAAVAGERTHRTGSVSMGRQDRDFANQPGAAGAKTSDEIAEALAKAEAELEAEAQRAIDADAAAQAAAEQLAREADEEVARADEAAAQAAAGPVDVKAELRAELEALGVQVHPATGEAKLREKLAEAKAAGSED